MDSTPVKRRADRVKNLHNPHFKPLWEPNTTVGHNAITYSLAHHAYQQRISTAGMCNFCTDELTRRVSEAARRLKSKGLFHDDKAFMDLFWQDASEEGGGDEALVAGETIVVRGKNGAKVSVADHATELALKKRSTSWWDERMSRFKREIAAVDRSEAVHMRSRVASWLDRLSGRDGGRGEAVTPWETRFLNVFMNFRRQNLEIKNSMMAFVGCQEKYLSFDHDNCQCHDILRLRAGVSFETVLMESVVRQIAADVWEVIPVPPEEILRNKARFLTYFADQSKSVRNGSILDYGYSSGEVNVDKTVPGPLPPGWQCRCQNAGAIYYYNCHGRIVSQEGNRSRAPHVPRAFEYTVDEENLIEL